MAQLVDCPSCRSQLRVPDELLGQTVQCPSCQTTFPAPAEAAVPSVEPVAAEAPRCPVCNEPIPADAEHCRLCGADLTLEDDRPWERPDMGHARRDAEPHRGGLILGLGIASVASAGIAPAFSGCTGLVALPLGITAWVLGSIDLKRMRAGQMDPQGLGLTQAGWICGIIGTLLSVFCVVGFALFFVLMVAGMRAMPAPAPVPVPVPVVPPPPPPPAPLPPEKLQAQGVPLRLVEYLPHPRG